MPKQLLSRRQAELLLHVAGQQCLADPRGRPHQQPRRASLDPGPDGELRIFVKIHSVAQSRKIFLHKQLRRLFDAFLIEKVLELVNPVLPSSPRQRLTTAIAESARPVLLIGPDARDVVPAAYPDIAVRATAKDYGPALGAVAEVRRPWRDQQVTDALLFVK
jgi:hypothetical protein